MANEHAILCGPVSSRRLPGDQNPLRLCIHKNVHLQIEEVRQAMYKDVPSTFLDLIDIATYVYCADQAITRGNGGLVNGTKDSPEVGLNWRRNLNFRVAVRNPELWKSRLINDELVSVLSFLSEDKYYFEFEHLKKDTNLGGYINYNWTPFDDEIEGVMLFSGGLDSLAGAVQESIIDRRRVLLINHRSTEKLTPRNRHLLELLSNHAQGRSPLLLPVKVNKDKELGREYTQRSRSFLYASLAATIATMVGIHRIRFYENGVVSLNLPPSAQVVGSRATRTTHPQVLNGYKRLLSHLAGKAFEVQNPFIWKTKTDVIKLISDAGCGGLIRYSTSCAHTWEMTTQHTHCGTCSQCIDRRFAILAAKQEENDPQEAYRVDLLTGERSDGYPRSMLAAYLETANEVNEMLPVQFFSRFGEATRVMKQFSESTDTVAQRIFGLYKQHSAHVTEVVDQAISKHGSAIRRRELPPSCLVRIVCDGSTSTADHGANLLTGSAGSRAPNIFRKMGQVWEVRFDNGEVNILLPTKGAAYLQILLSHPQASFSAIEMACRVARNGRDFSLGDAGERIDRDAMTNYRARFVELQAELDELRANNDLGRMQEIQEEMNDLANEIRRAQGLGGRIRRDSDDRERVRKAVGNAIRNAIKSIREFDRRMAEHLKTRVHCGRNPCYSPNVGVCWET